MKTIKTSKVCKKFITNLWYKDFNEILKEELEKLNEILKEKGSYQLGLSNKCISLYFKDKRNGFYMQSLAFFSDKEVINWIKGNINFYSIMK